MDFDLPDETRQLVGLAAEFGRAELGPTEVWMDAQADPEQAYTSEIYRSFRKQARAIGLHQISLPTEIGGLGLSPLTYYAVLQELAVAGAGLALVMQSDALGAALAAPRRHLHRVYADYVEAFRDDTEGVHTGAWTITEPDLGCDIHNPAASFAVRARPTAGGGGYVIDGAKSSWCSNGWLADMLVVMACVDPAAGMAGTGIFLIPADWPGIRRGRPVRKLGLRALNQCEISFDAVEVPREFMIFGPGERYARVLQRGFVAPGNIAVGSAAVGIARGAYEIGLRYVRERKQGGRPIGQHQLVAKRVFDAYAGIEASGLLLARCAWDLGRGVFDMPAVYAARVQACRTATAVTADMVYVHGANGVTAEYPVEKLLRDAQLLQFPDGSTDVVALKAAEQLIWPSTPA